MAEQITRAIEQLREASKGDPFGGLRQAAARNGVELVIDAGESRIG